MGTSLHDGRSPRRRFDHRIPAAGAASAQAEFPIPDIRGRSPDLVEVRDLIDDVDRRLVELLVQRQDLAKRAGHIKRRNGRPVRDRLREDALLAERAGWRDA
ncbi:MAG: chorismate mutase [Acidobacteriota bacterium]